MGVGLEGPFKAVHYRFCALRPLSVGGERWPFAAKEFVKKKTAAMVSRTPGPPFSSKPLIAIRSGKTLEFFRF
jgi:hypothetical protein